MDIPSWDTILKFIEELGWTKGVFTIFFFLAHGWLFKQYKDRIEDRQKEIDRIAEDNRAYRDMFLELTQKTLGLSGDKKNTEMKKPKQIKEKTKRKKEG